MGRKTYDLGVAMLARILYLIPMPLPTTEAEAAALMLARQESELGDDIDPFSDEREDPRIAEAEARASEWIHDFDPPGV
jgi:hypothetical protein